MPEQARSRRREPWFTPVSLLAGVSWPAMVRPEGAGVMAVLRQLDESQWWSPEALLEFQLGQLQLVLAHARATVPLYQQSFDEAGINLDSELTPESFAQIPILTRRDIQDNGAMLRSRELPPGHGNTYESQTSGSTGEPLTIGATDVTNYFWNVHALRDHEWHRRDLMAKMCAIRPTSRGLADPPDGATAPSWGGAIDTLYLSGESASLSIVADIGVQAEWLIRHDPAYLITLPSNLFALAEHFRAGGRKLPNLVELRAVSETVTPALRQICREVFGAPVVDMYTSQEAGYIALQCPEHEHYHVQAENVLVEILDADGRPCGPGEIGRVVLSTLHNFFMPLIRYDIGDYAEVGEPCPCGRGLPVLKRILGRERNMLILPTGERRWPFTGYREYREIAPIRQFQLVQRSLTAIEARFVADRPLDATEQDRLKALIRSSLDHPFEVTLVFPESLPRSAGGKFEEFVSEVGL